MPLRKVSFLIVMFYLVAVRFSSAQSTSNWQTYSEATYGVDLQSSASLSFSSNRQNLWVTHVGRDTITKLDGYRAESFPAPELGEEVDFRVYESDSGQLWALHSDGVQSLTSSGWERHVIGKVQRELRDVPLRRVRQIPLLPAEQNNVLVLLSDQLIKYDSRRGESVVLLDRDSFELGNFIDLIPSSDGGLWIAADSGVIRVRGEFKRSDSFSDNEVYALPEELGVQLLQHPYEFDNAFSMMAAGSEGEDKFLVEMSSGTWSKVELPRKNFRRCWTTPDGQFWGLLVRQLYQWTQSSPEPVLVDVERGPHSDVVVTPSGAFFVSGPNGVRRYAPVAWRRPLPIVEAQRPVRSLVNSEEAGLWFFSDDRLVEVDQGRFIFHASEELQSFEGGDAPALLESHDGRLLLLNGSGLQAFDTSTHKTVSIDTTGYRGLRPLGKFDESSTLFVDGENNLVGFDGDRLSPFEFSVSADGLGDWASLLALDDDSRLLGGTKGVARLNNGGWTTFSMGDGDMIDGALTMSDIGDGDVWIGGFSRLQQFRTDSFTEVNSLSLNRSGRAVLDRVNSILRDREGNIWVAAANGVWVQRQGSWFRFRGENGLPQSVLTLCEASDGEMWIGSASGAIKYFADTDTAPPQTLLVDAPDGRQVSREERITFSFVGRDKWNANLGGRLQYRWRIDDGAWSPFSEEQSYVSYARTLAEGSHSFGVVSIDIHGNLDPTEAITRFNVIIPWWQVTRLRWIVGFALAAVAVFAGLAVNRHVRLTRSYAEIEKIVDERTRQLERANRELAHSEKMRSLGTLAAGVAHDFNSILSIIRGSVQIIEANPDNKEKVQTRVNRIKSMVEQGSTLVKSMLGFSRADDAELTLSNVAGVVEDSVQLMGDRLPADVKVSVEAATGLPAVHGNRELLQQIIVNLVLNAVDAMEGEGTLVLRCQHAHQVPESWVLHPAKAGDYVIVTVEDTGCGISPDKLSRIFEPFYTTKSFSTRHGTGLGLSMVYEFCKELGYGLNVRSEVNRGTSFNVVIPVLQN